MHERVGVYMCVCMHVRMCMCVLICDIKCFQYKSQSHLAWLPLPSLYPLQSLILLFFPIWLRFLINHLTLDLNPLHPHSVKAGLNTVVLNPGVFTNLQPNFQPLADTMIDLPIIPLLYYLCEHHITTSKRFTFLIYEV